MVSLHPVVIHGCSVWDRDTLPIDEFQERLRAVRRTMAAQGLRSLLIYGDTSNYGLVCYLTNFIPMLGWALALVPREGPVRLIVAVGGSRDLPFARSLTWVEDVRFASDLSVELSEWVASSAEAEGSIGICGSRWMSKGVHQTVQGACSPFPGLREADALITEQMATKRPRELAAIRKGCDILTQAKQAMVQVKAGRGGVVGAVIEAERVARSMKARDVRTLFSLTNGRTLQPFETATAAATDSQVVQISVNCLGYWAEGLVTITDPPSPAFRKAAEVLKSLIDAVRPGMRVADLEQLVDELLLPYSRHEVTSRSLCQIVGLFQTETEQDSGAALQEGRVYSLRVGVSSPEAGHALLSAMVAFHGGEKEILWSAM